MIETFGDDVGAFPFPGDVGKWTIHGRHGECPPQIQPRTRTPRSSGSRISRHGQGTGDLVHSDGKRAGQQRMSNRHCPMFQNSKFMKGLNRGERPVAGILPILDTTTEWISTIMAQYHSGSPHGQGFRSRCDEAAPGGTVQKIIRSNFFPALFPGRAAAAFSGRQTRRGRDFYAGRDADRCSGKRHPFGHICSCRAGTYHGVDRGLRPGGERPPDELPEL